MIPIPERGIYLASRSPRRRELLSQIGVRFHLLLFRERLGERPEVDETVLEGEAPAAYVERMARAKAEAGWKRMLQRNLPQAPVLAADTTVALGGRILGKPGTGEEALEMLRALSGRTHQVMTAVAVGGAGARCVTAAVTFAAASEASLRWYVSTGEPMDKAGGYAVQAIGGFLVERIEGSFSTVVGLPLVETLALLGEAGYTLPWDER